MIILTLFGTTTGLELQNFSLGNNVPALKFEEAWVGVTPSQVSLRQGQDAFVVFRKSVSGHLTTWIGIYRQAREIGYDRPGGFYGAGAWIIDHVADARLLTDSLVEMMNQIQAKTMNGDRFVRNIAEARNEFAPPSQTAALLAGLTKANSGLRPEGESAFIVEGSNAIDVIEWAQRAPSASYLSKAVIGAANQTPSIGQSSTLRLFTSHLLAIDAAYQRLFSESHNAISQANNQIHELSQRVDKLTKDNSALTDDLNDARASLQQAQVNRMPSSTSAGYHGGFYLTTEASPKATSMYTDSADDRWPAKAPAQKQPAIPPNGYVGSARTQPNGLVDREVTPAANPGGQVKPEGAKRITPAHKATDHQSESFLGFAIFLTVTVILLAVIIMGVITRDTQNRCAFFTLGCSPKPPQQNRYSPILDSPNSPSSSSKPHDDGNAK